jgi:septum formation protein
MTRWILASASPRRQQLLKLLLSQFDVVPSDVEETPRPAESPLSVVQRLAKEKATAVQRLHPTAAIISADTVVVCNQEILGKPSSPEEARHMLQKLSGRTHQVLTGVCLLHGETCRVQVSSTGVQFYPLSEAEIDTYVKSGEPLDKAGAYGIQGLGARFIEKIDGCYFNVVGLPVSLVYRMLKQEEYQLYG